MFASKAICLVNVNLRYSWFLFFALFFDFGEYNNFVNLTLQQRAGTSSATKMEQHVTFEQLKIFKLPHILQKTI